MNELNKQRKRDHLDIVLNQKAEFDEISTGFHNYRFIHNALPELDLDAIDLSISLFGKILRAPFMISPMVGGIEAAQHINRNLAKAAQIIGLAMGVGSQRCAIEDPDLLETYRVRSIAPDILLFANLGAVQLNYGYSTNECKKAIEAIDADGLILHLNPLHEALQPEGNTNFSNLLMKIGKLCNELKVPVIVKEVGFGISEHVARQLAERGVAAIDVAGSGGTSWSEIERDRALSQRQNRIASSFNSWGIPTSDSIVMSRRGAPHTTLIASGGMYTGNDAAKAIALGTDIVGIGRPLLKAANISSDETIDLLTAIIEEMRISMFCIGASNISELKNTVALHKVES